MNFDEARGQLCICSLELSDLSLQLVQPLSVLSMKTTIKLEAFFVIFGLMFVVTCMGIANTFNMLEKFLVVLVDAPVKVAESLLHGCELLCLSRQRRWNMYGKNRRPAVGLLLHILVNLWTTFTFKDSKDDNFSLPFDRDKLDTGNSVYFKITN